MPETTESPRAAGPAAVINAGPIQDDYGGFSWGLFRPANGPASARSQMVMYKIEENGREVPVYCLEYGVANAGGYASSAASPDADTWNRLSQAQRDAINTVLFYGYRVDPKTGEHFLAGLSVGTDEFLRLGAPGGNQITLYDYDNDENNSEYGQNLSALMPGNILTVVDNALRHYEYVRISDIRNLINAYYAATQIMVWEIVEGMQHLTQLFVISIIVLVVSLVSSHLKTYRQIWLRNWNAPRSLQRKASVRASRFCGGTPSPDKSCRTFLSTFLFFDYAAPGAAVNPQADFLLLVCQI